MKILITNIVALNGGDGAILFGMIKILKQTFGEDCDISVYSSQPEATKSLYPETTFRETIGLAAVRTPFSSIRYLGRIFRNLQQFRYKIAAWGLANHINWLTWLLPLRQRLYLKEYAEADMIVSSGGTYLKEEYGITSQVCDYQLTLILKRPLVFFTQSLGPFRSVGNRKVMRSIFNRSSLILVRDNQSLENIKNLGTKEIDMYQCADAAFALAEASPIYNRYYISPVRNKPLRIAISVRKWKHFSIYSNEEGWKRYRHAIAKAVTKLVQQGFEVTFMSTCQGISVYDDDANEAQTIISLLEANIASQIILIKDFIRHDELIRRLKEYDMCIATRMHMCILSLISGVPVLPISYEFKTKELFKALSLSEWVTDIECINPSEFCETIKQFIESMVPLNASIKKRVRQMHDSAISAGNLIKQTVERT